MLQQVFLLAVVAMIGLALLRLARVHRDRSPLPEGRGRTVFLVAFLVVPPFVLGALSRMAAGQDPVGGIAWVPIYVPDRGRARAPHGDRRHRRRDRGTPPVPTPAARRADRQRGRSELARVRSAGDDQARGERWRSSTAGTPRSREAVEFAAEVDRAGFRSDWDALDAATHALEGRMAEDRRLGLGVASAGEWRRRSMPAPAWTRSAGLPPIAALRPQSDPRERSRVDDDPGPHDWRRRRRSRRCPADEERMPSGRRDGSPRSSGDACPTAARATRAGARGTTTTLQRLPDSTLRWLAASSIGLAAGLRVAGAPAAGE